MPRERCLFLLPDFEPGGTQRVCVNLAAGVKDHDVDVKLVVFSDGGILGREVPMDIPVLSIKRTRLRHAAPALVRLLRREKPTVIFSSFGHINLAVLAAKPLLHRPIRLVIREPNTPSRSIPSLRFSRTIRAGYRLLYRRADAVVCQSDHIAQELERSYRVPANKLKRVHNPVVVSAIRSAAVRPKRPPGGDTKFIVVGSLTKKKGIDRLLEWMRRHHVRDSVTIVGDGPEGVSLKRQAVRAGLADRVRWVGNVANPWALIAGADVLLLPSRWEGMPNVLLEALACGTPVIATAEAGGVAEVAKLARPNAVSLAKDGEEFIKLMSSVNSRQSGELRENLLPDVYCADNVSTAMAKILHGS
jgi:glycosyltransferase involved in cell wall biosynthesis